MDISSLIGTLMSSDSLQNIASVAGTADKDVKDVLSAALPSLIDGAKEQCGDTATGFADALLSHGKADTSDLASFIKNIDIEDGGKIIGHLLGGKKEEQLDGIAKSTGVTKAGTANILSLAAPLLMSLLGQQATSSAEDSSPSAISSIASSLLGNADIGSILGSLLGGTSATGTASSGGFLAGLLGKLFKK